MTRLEVLFLVAVVAFGCVAFALISHDVPQQHVELPTAKVVPSPRAPTHRDVLQEQVEMGRTHRETVDTKAKPIALNAESEALLTKFDEISELLEATPTDCDALAYGLSTILGPDPLRVEAFKAAPPSKRPKRETGASVVTRFERFSLALKSAMPSCREQLQPHLRKLHGLQPSTAELSGTGT